MCFWYVDIAPVKPIGYMGRPAASGAAGPSGARAAQNEDAVAILEEIRHRCERLLTGVFERGWKDLDDQYI